MIVFPPLVERLRGPLTAILTGVGRSVGPEPLVLGYHDVLSGDRPAGLSVSAADLRRHIGQLRRAGYRIVSVPTVVEAIEAGSPAEPLAAITFDDALGGLFEHGLPVLVDEEVVATVFAVSDFLGVPPPWWPGMTATFEPEQLAGWVDAGQGVGSHTRTHRSLPSLDGDELVEELAGSRRSLEELLAAYGSPVTVDLLAYPSGHHDRRVRQAAAEAGYRAAFTFLNGRVTPGDDRFRLPRINAGAHSTPARLEYHLRRSADSWPDHQVEAVGPAED